jgi:hypothetical protein
MSIIGAMITTAAAAALAAALQRKNAQLQAKPIRVRVKSR